VANVSYSETVASLIGGGGVVFEGTGNGQVCQGYTLIGGIPSWAMAIIICWIFAMFFMAFAWTR
jgi:ABC-type proline/glycine betaine transport system permease subunit